MQTSGLVSFVNCVFMPKPFRWHPKFIISLGKLEDVQTNLHIYRAVHPVQ